MNGVLTLSPIFWGSSLRRTITPGVVITNQCLLAWCTILLARGTIMTTGRHQKTSVACWRRRPTPCWNSTAIMAFLIFVPMGMCLRERSSGTTPNADSSSRMISAIVPSRSPRRISVCLLRLPRVQKTLLLDGPTCLGIAEPSSVWRPVMTLTSYLGGPSVNRASQASGPNSA